MHHYCLTFDSRLGVNHVMTDEASSDPLPSHSFEESFFRHVPSLLRSNSLADLAAYFGYHPLSIGPQSWFVSRGSVVHGVHGPGGG